ncbi:hypothetical protein [Actinomadura sp. 7K507]|uniref:hypothetical protein n=1 Tax=Actinomadura sp. 7K507 TaxID=2530365 RepID=UPI0010474693|nr:hypothetical protein [Actinomadura sp. 7K507]TDC81156.1 hypothetical protein E1285_33230 [Actinomadura sp. 7K507]
MKISCACGEVIPDQTDFIPYKARFVADMDWDDVAEGDVGERLWEWSRCMWQCTACGRLYVEDRQGGLHCFAPEKAGVPSDLLGSAHGDAWKRPLVGNWRARASGGPPGELWWGFGVSDEGMEEFSRWSDLERRYHEVFERLRDRDVLRSAFLRHEGRIVHEWPGRAPEGEVQTGTFH